MGPLYTRRQFVVGTVAVGLALLAGCGPLAWRAAPPPKVPRIGVLSPGSPGPSPYLDVFRVALHEHSYVEAQNISIEYRYTEGRPERFPELAAELVALPVDAILVIGSTPQVRRVKELTTTIPIVFVAAGDPIRDGLVTSLARPGGNLTGLSTMATGLAGKRLEHLKVALPELTRVAILWNTANPAKARELAEAQAAAPGLGLDLQSLAVREPTEIDTAFQAATQGRAEGLVVLMDPLMFGEQRRIVALAAESRLPAIYADREFVEAGGLMSYGPSLVEGLQRAAYYVARVLDGTSPADLPVERPRRLELIVNLTTARELGITFPQELLLRIASVVE
jgi:putative ABC transport system substrate-binding protein